MILTEEQKRGERMQRKKKKEELTPEEYRIITESDRNATYKLRFRILEILGDLF